MEIAKFVHGNRPFVFAAMTGRDDRLTTEDTENRKDAEKNFISLVCNVLVVPFATFA